MACGHKVLLLVDTAGEAARHGPARRATLRLLTYLSCRFGLARVHWAFKFFDSQGARSRPSRVSDFRELGSRSWEDFEEELEARLGDRAPGAHLPGPTPRATHTHGALMETLLDYQWDRPEITSPTKPILRSSGRRLLDADSEAREAQAALGGFGNAVFLLAPCPHSQRELLQFVSGCEAQDQRVPLTPRQVMEKVLPKRVQEVMIARNITLYWVDTTERSKLWASPDHVGYWTVCELLHHGGGTILPSETWSLGFTKVRETALQSGGKLSHEPHLSPWISALPIDATVNCLLYNSPEYEASFPQTAGTLFLPVKGKEIQETWTVSLEPLAMHQRHFQKPIQIFLTGSVAQWSLSMSSELGTDNWMLQSPGAQRLLFQELVSRLTAEEFHLVASVDPGEGWPPITGIISPFSANAMILTVFRAKEAEFQRHFLQTAAAEGPQEKASLFSDVVDSVLNQVHNLSEDPVSSAPCVPEWAQQELSRTSPWSPALIEKWFPFSNVSGATSDLMESFWLVIRELTRKLTQCHVLLLQICQLDAVWWLSVFCITILFSYFKTEEDLMSYIHENYHKTVATGETTLYSCAQNMVSTIKVFLKSKDVKEVEVVCLNHMNNSLLKTSKTLRQNHGGKLDKEDKVRECQLQVFLRLELCQQCPSILESTDEVEQVVEEVTDLLRMVCLTKDSAYLSEFLEEILRLYIDSIPGTIGQLYHSLGLKIPQKLAGVLPTEFFSDDSMTLESKSPPPPSSAHRSVSGVTESEQLEELRTRSAKKRRKNALIRHKSIAEISQTLRQIEVPKVSKRATRNENSHLASAQPSLPRKDTGQEVTKVRRNLFNEEMLSPSKRGLKRGLPRSHSVSALESLHHKHNSFKKTKSSTFQGYHKLLTKSVAETPVHKQISRRLLHRQIKGRSSDPGPDIHVVEESPEKEDGDTEHHPLIEPNSIALRAMSSPELLAYTCMAGRRQSETGAQQGSPHTLEATGSPQTYEVELEMQTSGLPKLRIKKVDPGAFLEAEAPGKESPLEEEGSLPALSMPKASKSSSTYLSPPCLRPSHSTPGKNGGQTFICQSCTPSRCPPSTPSPFQADVGVSWTPSPKQSGKTTPEIIKDWPRRKRAVDCSAGPCAGRGEASADFPGVSSLPEAEGKEQSLEGDLTKALVLEDFELEGVCQLPDQTPPKDRVSKAEEAFSWGQFGLGSRKRHQSAKEEAEYDVKRVCDSQSEDPQASNHREWSPHWSAPPVCSVGDDEVFVSGSTPPSGCMVRSSLSASSLQALTQSPLLFQGRTPSSHSKDGRDEDVDVFPSTTEVSPFSQAFSRRRPFRTYTRKKLIS
ncbi:Treslin [Microtus ochrogaster]|uniref:Treslin n=1 Tax=Microtus ochrogaster TaxID=79684 RepID=A0A8J6G4X1_MICOH|nr:Treslin [Microtus ochrogaster]